MIRSFALLALLSGCIGTTRHTLADISALPLDTSRGTLTVVKTNGTTEVFAAPYSAKNDDGLVTVRASKAGPTLMPSATFDAAQVSRLEETAFSPGKTKLLVGGVVTGVAVVAGVIGAVAAAASFNSSFSANFRLFHY